MQVRRGSGELTNLKSFTHTNILQFKAAQPVVEQPAKDVQPHSIYIVGTGGTIVGTAASATAATYAPSQLTVEQLIESMPALKDFGDDLHAVSLYKVNSEDLTTEHWLNLGKKVNELLADPEVKGVVITHGTDTLEETAYFLDLVVKSHKPVVIVGSMRASTSLSADGPLNLYNALAVIHSEDAKGRGVMVMMNDTIYDGRDVTKRNTTQVNTFDAPNSGSIGHVTYGQVHFERSPTRKNTTATPFDIANLEDLPRVEIVYECAGSSGVMMKAAVESKPAGIVIAGSGDGNLHARDRAFLKYAADAGITIVRSSRTGSGYVTENDGYDFPAKEDGTIAGDNLNAQKARILLMLSLAQNSQRCEIRDNFRKY